MSYDDWIKWLDTLNLDEIQVIYWDIFDSASRRKLNKYLHNRMFTQKNEKNR